MDGFGQYRRGESRPQGGGFGEWRYYCEGIVEADDSTAMDVMYRVLQLEEP